MIKPDKNIILESRQRSIQLGLDTKTMPNYIKRLSSEQLGAKCYKFKEEIDVIHYFIDQFLSSVEGTPLLITISDDEGYILKFKGDVSIRETVHQLGIVEGTQFTEEAGTNSIALALKHKKPIQVIGDDHYQHFLHSVACYSVPFHEGKDHQVRGTLSFMTLVKFANPYLLGLLSTMVDSIERELLLRRQNTQLHILNQLLLETSHHGVIITDTEGNIVDGNENIKPIINENASILDIEPLGTYFRQVITNQQETIGLEVSFGINGTTRYYILDVVPIFDQHRSFIRVVGTLRDISDMKKTEELLRNTEKLAIVGQLAAGVAHEIRNPLTTVKGLIQFSKDTFQPHHYDLILSELVRMNYIVSELLVLGKPQAVPFDKTDCLSILKEVLKLFEIQAQMNGISITTEIRNHSSILCDANQMKQVFINLLKNSMEAMPYGGNMHVTLDMQGFYQLIRFRDDGVGIPEEVLGKIGQPFCSTKKDGNGLGLMVTKKILDAHQGQIHFTSRVDEGTTVDILIPCVS